ncbi:MAG: phosphomethylpyrimidine synthase ThiC [Desulfovibrio sp.]|uniref:phosphomethylpyrimidine synthase ThiC n=1 Tax=Desulfovibrio sp. TaxID=885 RepID=UPI001A6D6C7D|nr:phosphomethylpyrimidine synthase ThiC [Desulfovibrio sp.]MBD5417021.1 phosphomethylpyrimidine synthase ThiC [Desulfovibrio sp.]
MASTLLSKNAALSGLCERHLATLAREEALDEALILEALDAGTMAFLGNPAHPGLKPILVGQPARVKVNANLGTSPLSSCMETERAKIAAAARAGADTIMDLSIAGDLDAIRREMLAAWQLPLGTVPMYAVGQQLLDAGRDIASMKPDDLFAEIEKQARQGVDFVTVHCGLSRRGAELAVNGGREMGIVSRGGSMLARWMLENDRENPLLEEFDRLVDISLKHNLVLSLGDGLRPGAGADAGDAAQWEEVINLGVLARRALERGVQCMIEGPGHVPLNQVRTQIQGIKRLTHGAPLYVLGPLCCDSAPGYDHIAGAIGGALGVEAGVDFLCYLTPAEHLTLPDAADVAAGVMASRVAAQVGEVALGRPGAVAREKAMNAARKALDWDGMAKAAIDPEQLAKRREPHKGEEVCAMCGKFCAVKMLRETKAKKA